MLNRAGFGPTPGQADQLASLGLVGAVHSLTRPSDTANLVGPDPTTMTASHSPPPTRAATTISVGSTG